MSYPTAVYPWGYPIADTIGNGNLPGNFDIEGTLTVDGLATFAGGIAYAPGSGALRNVNTQTHSSTTTSDFGAFSYTMLGTGRLIVQQYIEVQGKASANQQCTLTLKDTTAGGTTVATQSGFFTFTGGPGFQLRMPLDIASGTLVAGHVVTTSIAFSGTGALPVTIVSTTPSFQSVRFEEFF